jgi:hypothetical protein
MLSKRASRGKLALAPALESVLQDCSPAAGTDEETRLVRNARKIALFALAIASGRSEQEILMNIADIVIELFAMESCLLRSRKTGAAADHTAVYLRDAMGRIEISARNVIGAVDGSKMSILRRLAAHDPINAIELRRKIARRLLETERYVI